MPERAARAPAAPVAVDPCFRELLADPRVELRRPSPRLTLADLREGTARFMGSARGPAVTTVTDLVLVTADGRPLRARRYQDVEGTVPAVLFCHGGGFVFGGLDTHDAMCRALAVASGAAIVALDYRRAPEHPFPAALDDAASALAALATAPSRAGVLGGRLAVAGESAGGHIAIGAALTARDAGAPLAHLGLIYPVIEPGCDSDSMQTLATGCLLSREAMQWYWDCYVPEASVRTDPRVDLRRAALAGLPSTTLAIAGCDPLRDEDEDFADRLAAAGVPIEVHRYPGMVHGFAGLPQLTPVAGRALETLGRALGRALGTRPSAEARP